MNPRPFLPLFGLLAGAAQADQVMLSALRDTTFNSTYTGNSDGGGPAIFSGADGNGGMHRALIGFDLTGIPAGATVTNVQLTLTLGQVPNGSPGTATISLFPVSRNWGEGTNGSGATSIAGTGQGYPANAGDATWSSAFFGSTAWTTPGGDYASSPSATLFLSNDTIGNSFTWASSQMIADVQAWVRTPATNYGWELINAAEKTPRSLYGFYSREWSTGQPVLQVTYSLPAVPIAPWAQIATVVMLASIGLRRSICRE